MRHLDTHQCAATRCPHHIPLQYLMCRAHWAMVPRPIQAAVYATYNDGEPTREYVSAVRAAIDAVAKIECTPALPPQPTLPLNPDPTPQTKPTLSPESVEAARKAARVLVSEGLIAEAQVKRRLWLYIEGTMQNQMRGDYTHDQITPAIVEEAARDLRKNLVSNQGAASALAASEAEAAGTKRAHSACRSCGQPIRWQRTPGKSHTPVNLDGQPHWATCPQRGQWRRTR